jgi:hypothetical protein
MEPANTETVESQYKELLKQMDHQIDPEIMQAVEETLALVAEHVEQPEIVTVSEGACYANEE